MKKQAPKSKAKKSPETKRARDVRIAKLRKQAKELLDKWADEHLPVTLVAARMHILGHLVHLGNEQFNEHGDYLFKTESGISALIYLLCFDEFSINEDLPNQITISMSLSRFPEDTTVLFAHLRGFRPTLEKVHEVNEQFRTWAKLGRLLGVGMGDYQRTTYSVCNMAEHNDSAFVLEEKNAKCLHIIIPELSDSIEIKRTEHSTAITLHRRGSGSMVTIFDVAGQDDPLSRLPVLTTLLQ